MTPMKSDIISNRHTHRHTTARFSDSSEPRLVGGSKTSSHQGTNQGLTNSCGYLAFTLIQGPTADALRSVQEEAEMAPGNKGMFGLFTYCLCVFHPKVGCDEDMGAIAYNILPFFGREWSRQLRTCRDVRFLIHGAQRCLILVLSN